MYITIYILKCFKSKLKIIINLRSFHSNKPVKFDENVVYKKSSSENNNTHKLEINNVRAEDAGRYAVQCR